MRFNEFWNFKLNSLTTKLYKIVVSIDDSDTIPFCGLFLITKTKGNPTTGLQ